MKARPIKHDDELGWTLNPGSFSHSTNGSLSCSILSNGFRSNGNRTSDDDSYDILAVGDSFTFGDNVGDNETWPAHLEMISQLRVANAGVPGYGLDQTILRLHRLISQFNPSIVLIGMIPDDITRCNHHVLGNAYKPYYAIENSELVLKGQPVPPPPATNTPPGPFRRLFSRSHLFHAIAIRVAREQWVSGTTGLYQSAHEDGEIVAVKLLENLDDLAKKTGKKIFLIVQYSYAFTKKDVDMVKRIIKKSELENVFVLDSFPLYQQLRSRDAEGFRRIYTSNTTSAHHTSGGNKMIAKLIYDFMKKSLDSAPQISR